jgi:hypothetical protein
MLFDPDDTRCLSLEKKMYEDDFRETEERKRKAAAGKK